MRCPNQSTYQPRNHYPEPTRYAYNTMVSRFLFNTYLLKQGPTFPGSKRRMLSPAHIKHLIQLIKRPAFGMWYESMNTKLIMFHVAYEEKAPYDVEVLKDDQVMNSMKLKAQAVAMGKGYHKPPNVQGYALTEYVKETGASSRA
jgi:hypothetical protein